MRRSAPLIPLGGSVPTASTYMNFVYDPKIAAELSLGANYISSVKGVKGEASKLNPDAAANTLAFPTDDMLSQMHQNDPTMFSNAEYEKKFGRIYIVCATGKTAEEMLAIAKERMKNDPDTELRRAADEQRKITELRLDKLVLK